MSLIIIYCGKFFLIESDSFQKYLITSKEWLLSSRFEISFLLFAFRNPYFKNGFSKEG